MISKNPFPTLQLRRSTRDSLGGLVLSGLLALLSSAQGAAVFGNGNLSSTTTDSNGFTFNANNAWAVPFTTGSSTGDDLELTGATVLIGDTDAAITVSVEIFADTGTNGGPTGSALASGSASISAGALQWQSISFSSTISLSANTNYYFAVVRGTGGSSEFTWENPTVDATYSDLGSGSSYAITPVASDPQHLWRRQNSDGLWVDSGSQVTNSPVGFQLNAVPEPSSALLGAGALVFLLRRRRSSTH